MSSKTTNKMLSAEANTSRRPRSQDSAHALLSLKQADGAVDNQTKKRKHADVLTESGAVEANGYMLDGVLHPLPPDFDRWLTEAESAGEWNVMCGRGGESNHAVGNKKYRLIIKERKEEYRKLDPKQRKQKTAFVKDVVDQIHASGGRFVDVDQFGKYYVVKLEKAKKKTSQALRETKELKWLDIDKTSKKKGVSTKDITCPFCKKKGHKTKIAKSCLFHNQWLDASKVGGNVSPTAAEGGATDGASEQGPGATSVPNTKEELGKQGKIAVASV